MSNKNLIEHLYDSLGQRNSVAMGACYASDATFTDPAFGTLNGEEIEGMWSMLTSSAGKLEIKVSDVMADDEIGSATWIASYQFGPKKNDVVNRISAQYTFKDGLIQTHTDSFNFHTWARQALGPVGLLLGWTPYLQDKAKQQARAQLKRHMEKAS